MAGRVVRLGWALALLVPAPAGAAPTPLVPRDLAPLAAYAETLVEVDPRSAAAASRLRAAGGRLVHPALGVWALPSAAALREIPALARAGTLREFAPDRPLEPAGHLAEPLAPTQWWLQAVGADLVEPPGPGVPVTILDSGVDVSHPELAGRPDTELMNPQTATSGDDDHGTAVASIVGAPLNGVGLAGAYPAAVLRSWDVSPAGSPSIEHLVAGLAEAGRRGRGVANLSLGSNTREAIVADAVAAAVARGVLVVAASGNDGERGNRPSFPAALPHVLTVGAVDRSGEAAAFSTRSPTVDLGAPGVDIPVAVPTWASPTGYAVADGTSFAAPIVAAAAAWVWTARPDLAATQVAEILRRSARDAGPPGRDPLTGFGVLDLPAALAAPAPEPDPQEPNDDVRHVSAGGILASARRPLTAPGRARAAVRARLDRHEDPVDVYRVWIPAGRRLAVEARSSRDLALELWRAETVTVLATGLARRSDLVARSDGPGGRIERVVVANRGGRGTYAYVKVSVAGRAALPDLAYTLTAAARPLPPRR